MKIRDLNQIVVVPWDFSDLSLDALVRAVEMVENPSLIRAVHVCQIPTPYEVGIAWESVSEKTIRSQTEESFQQRIEGDAKLKGVSINFRVLFGDPGTEICKFAQEQGANLIMIPSHGRSGLSRLMLGSVAERVVRFAHCPVLVLRDIIPASEHLAEPGLRKSVTVFG